MPRDILGIRTDNYRVQMQSHSGQRDVWLTTYKPDPSAPETRTVPAVFVDIVDAEIFTNKMRDENPRSIYRVVRDITITEVVHI